MFGTCPRCFTDQPLIWDGTVRPHGMDGRESERRWTDCPGSLHAPAPKHEPFVLDLASNPHPDLLAGAAYYRSIRFDSTETLAMWHGVLAGMCLATGLGPDHFEAWLDAHPEVTPALPAVHVEIRGRS